jgi:hypothetical protein
VHSVNSVAPLLTSLPPPPTHTQEDSFHLVDSRPQKAPKFGNKRFQQQRFQQQRREREARQEGGREKTKQQQQKRQQWGNWRDQQRVGDGRVAGQRVLGGRGA